MSKNIKKILLLVLVLVLIFLAYFLLKASYQEKIKNTPAEKGSSDIKSEAATNNEATGPSAAEFVPEMMTDAEKTEMKLSPQLNLQVISRDADGKVEAYKIIRAQSDIINLNQ
jgi:uncharacterized protein (UPF0333 family)